MAQRKRFKELENALCEYAKQDVAMPIRFQNLMDQLEGRFGEFNNEENAEKRSKAFFDKLYKYLFKLKSSKDWFHFWEMSLLHFLDTYFQKQIEHHGFHILAAQEILNDPEMLENPDYWLNSAHPKEVATVEYYQNLLACQTLWHTLSAEARQKAEEMCFPLPVIS